MQRDRLEDMWCGPRVACLPQSIKMYAPGANRPLTLGWLGSLSKYDGNEDARKQ